MTRTMHPGSVTSAPWFLFLAVTAFLVPASSTPIVTKPAFRIAYTSHAPKLEQFLEGAPREAGAAITDFRQRQPKDGDPASQPTAAYLFYDDHNFYAVFVCKDDPAKVRAQMSRREAISNDDKVGISLDTFHDGRRAYMFFANPLGVQLDGIVTEGQPDDYKFDTVWHSEGRLTPDGYIVRFAIPFKSVRFSDSGDRTWGIALTRNIKRNQEYSTWPRITDRMEAYVPQFAVLEGLEHVSPSRNIQIIPYGFFASQRFLNDVPQFRNQNEIRGGVDSKVILHDTLTLDLTVNPDFSQVESDEPQVTVNQRYEVYFPEKRPFFLENAGFFQTPEPLFFSRRIVDPQFGARLTGKVGSWGLGFLAMDDRAPGLLDGTGGRARIGVARVQREMAKGSNIGVMMTSREFGRGFNQVFSADARFKLNSNWVLTGQAMRSETHSLRDERLGGSALFAEVRHMGRHLQYYTNYRDRDPDFRSQLGYIPRVDIRQLKNSAGYRWRPEGGRLLNFGPTIQTIANWDHQGRLQDWSVETPFYFEFRGPTSLMVSRGESFELFRNQGFRKNATSFAVSSDWLKRVGVTAAYSRGQSVNFYPASGLTAFSARSDEASLELTFRPTARTRLDETYYYTRLGTRSASIFNNHLMRSKLNYQFTRALSLRAILDYDSVLPNASLVRLERAKRLTSDVLLTYLVNPATAIYAGYTSQHENLALFDGSRPELRRTDFPGLSTGRQVFVKVSYLFRF